jgi:hypothetical protein
MTAVADRPEVPEEWIARLDAVLAELPGSFREPAWVGQRWKVGRATVAHVFGGEDQRYRITFRGEGEEVTAFEHLGEPYFRVGWGENVIGMILDDSTDWQEVAEAVTDSYRLQAPRRVGTADS